MVNANYTIIQNHYAASDRGDITAMLADLAPDAAWTEMAGFPCAGTYIGTEAILQGVFGRIVNEWEGFRFTLERLCDAGNTIIAIGHYSGAYKRTGKFMRCRVTHVWQLKQGMIVAFEQFCDTLLVAQAMQ